MNAIVAFLFQSHSAILLFIYPDQRNMLELLNMLQTLLC